MASKHFLDTAVEVHFYSLGSIRHPEVWLELNPRAQHKQGRYMNRVELKKQLSRHPELKDYMDDQMVFAIKTSPTKLLQIVSGVFLDRFSVQVDSDVLVADAKHNRVLRQTPGKDKVQQALFMNGAWKPLRVRKPSEAN